MDRTDTGLTYIGAALLSAVALWSMRTVLGPVIATGALFILLWPLRRQPGARRLLLVVALLAALWILAQARSIVYPALLALGLAFLLDPLVRRLARFGIHRRIASLAVIVPVAVILLLFFLVLLPAVLEQLRGLVGRLPDAYRTVVAWIEPQIERLVEERQPFLPQDLSSLLPAPEQILRTVTTGLIKVGRGVAAVAQVAAFLILTPILTYYILADFNRLQDTARPFIPPLWRERLSVLGEEFQRSVGGWLKGQLIVAFLMTLLALAGFLIIGLPYALLLALAVGVLNLVPVLGFWITAALTLVITLFTPNPLDMLWKAALVLLITQALEQNALSPLFVGRQLRVKPIVLLLVMLGLGSLLGLAGLLLAAPAIGLAHGLWAIFAPRPAAPGMDAAPPAPETGAGRSSG